VKSALFGVGAGVALAGLIVACHTVPAPTVSAYQKADEITMLWTQIRGWRHDARMDLDPTPASLTAVIGKQVPDAKRACPDGHEVPKTCDDICDIADAICDNAEAICGLAAELGKANTWAQDKCTSAKASCRESKQRCCDCSGGK
jgi:hypothetical protein